MSAMDLYQQELMEHYRNPRNKGTLVAPDMSSKGYNPSCGDMVSIQAKVHQGNIVALAFMGHGCVISQAAASLVTEHCLNKSVEYVQNLSCEMVMTLLGIPLGPVRVQCALLVRDALRNACKAYHA
jgi:nitrogen fixation NifU-like protein